MGFNAVLLAVKDRAHGEMALKGFESLLNLCKQYVELPHLGGILCAEVGAQKIAAFTTADFAQFVFAQPEAQSPVLCDLDFNESPSRRVLAFGSAEFE
jgi:hypothetical protein